MPEPLVEHAPAKINLTLRVLGRRADGYHDLESLVVFADCRDRLTLTPGLALRLTVGGPRAAQAGAGDDNLVLKATRALQARIADLTVGAFHLDKELPVAAGIGGGSADAAAALRLLARANGLARDDARLFEAARAAGADVPVCLDPRPRIMRGIGEQLSQALAIPMLDGVLVNPGVALATKDVFAGWQKAPTPAWSLDAAALAKLDRDKFLHAIAAVPNDLEGAASALAPAITAVLTALRAAADCRLARMSGSGATCFGIFGTAQAAAVAAQALGAKNPQWWVRAVRLGA